MSVFHLVEAARRRFRRATIRQKLILLIMLVVLVAQLFTALNTMLLAFYRERGRLVLSSTAVAQVVSANSTAALAFRDTRALNEILASQRPRPNVLFSCIYDEAGVLMGSFVREPGAACPPADNDAMGGRFHLTQLTFREPIVLEGRRIGYLLIVTNLEELYERVVGTGVFVLIIL
ncbi:MAG: hypothetical protein NDJ90_15355, partial [Oligoflexia bacterium]|nr:hypothetical protein [Oligoflexia bacterium]